MKLRMQVQEFARRMASNLDESPEFVTLLLNQAAQTSASSARDYLTGIVAALRGRRQVPALPQWLSLLQPYQNASNQQLRDLANELLVVFGDGRTIDSLLAIARQRDADEPDV